MDHGVVAWPGEEASILNPERQHLSGPENLHDLINWSCESVNAIDFWTASGDIRHISYTALDDLTSTLAEQIAVLLRAAENHHDDVIVPVLVPQSPELYISWIAILKAGAAFCPIAIDSPTDRIKFILEDVNAGIVLTTARYEKWLADIAPKIKILSVSQSSLEARPRYTNPLAEADQDNHIVRRPHSLAYLMYTSGSTGLPKGVKISHQAVSQALLAHDEHLPNFKRFLQFASPTFDVSVFEIFFPLFRGATLVGRDRESMLTDLPGTVRAMNIDAAELTPTVANTLLKSREAAPCLQLLLTIGEMLSRPVIEEFGGSDMRPSILYAMYGPTEASIHCTIATRVTQSSSIHNIGQPLATVTAVIIGASAGGALADYKILPKGQVGELAVAGQLASGYLNRPDQTTAAFIDLPGYGRLYRTGDRARISDAGSLEMLGRLSSGQVKLRGQRVELGEIESIACGAPGVIMAVASVINGVLVLFCVEDGEKVSIADIRSYCKRHLLPFMVPTDIVVLELENLPRLPSGKMDRKMIENEYVRHENVHRQDDATPLDRLTAQICKSVSEELGRHISPAAPLWAEGLTSLMAIKIASALRAHRVEVAVRDLLELETIADVVARIKNQSSEVDMPAQSASNLIEDTESWQDIENVVKNTLGDSINIDKIEHILPCNAIQIAMLAETVSHTKLNFNSIELEALPGLTVNQIRTAMQKLAQKNEILRSGFVSIDHASMPFVHVIWSELDFDQNLSLLHPLNIERAKGDVNKFIIDIHHALYDGWSWELVMSDLNVLLDARPTPERPQFRDVSRRQRGLRRLQKEAAEDYWRGLLATATPFRLPQLNALKEIEHVQHWECRTLTTTRQNLTEFALQYHINPQTVLMAAVSLLLGSYTASSNTIFGLVSSGRHLAVPEIEKIIGPCLSTLPLNIDLSTVRTLQDLLLCVHTLQLDHLEHGALSLREILAVTGTNAEQKLFDSLFVWQENPMSFEPNPKNPVRIISTRDCLDYTLVIEVEPLRGEVVVKLTYDIAILSSQHANHFLAQLDYLVAEAVSNINASLHDIWKNCDLGILAVANAKPRLSDTSFDLTSTVQELADTSPRQIALAFTHGFDTETGAAHTEELTYGELWRQSNQIAHHLRKLCIAAEEIVCVCVEKSPDLYVLDLSIVIAGAAFLNIDIRTPPERISQILKEVKCKLVITGHDHISLDTLNASGYLCIPLPRLKAEAQKYQMKELYPYNDVGKSCLAYVVMTSGTTGIPKAILVTRENLLSNINVLSKLYPQYRDQNRILQACSPAFDVFVFELFWTWHMGFCLCSGTNDVLFRDIESFICASNVSHLSLTPSVASLIRSDNVPSVRFLVTAGEPVNSKVFGDWASRGLFQGYGPAETTNICTVRGHVQKDDLINNVGRPLPNTSIFICAKHVDEDQEFDFQILPIGAAGEIVIGGDQVARGYTDPVLTSRSFITTDFGRLYRSGDIGRLLANGDLVVLGREDDQVKLRGQRIELGDINTAISRAPIVADAVTFVANEKDCRAKLVSFWTRSGVKQIQNVSSSLYKLLDATLPTYMVPEVLVPIEAMPLTRQGKIDRTLLMQRFKDLNDFELQQFSRGAVDSEVHEEFTNEEILIAQAVSEVTNMQLSSLKPTTSFYSLGLDSISGLRLSQKLRQANIGHVGVSLILKNCSVRKLRRAIMGLGSTLQNKTGSSRLDELFETKWRRNILSIAEAEGQLVESIIPCTALQESILVAQANTPSSAIYEARMRFEVKGDVNKVLTAWSYMVTRHQILRTGFAITPSANHAYAQIILKDFELPCYSSSKGSSTTAIASKDSILPPWRLILHDACASESVSITLIMSHALYDFEALAIMLEEIELRYKSQELRPLVPPDAYIRYMVSMNMEEVDAFWQSRLEDYKPRSFTELFETEKTHGKIQRTFTRTSKFSQKKLQAAAEQYSATPSVLCQTAWVRLLSCYMESKDVVFGNVFSGRSLSVEGVLDIVAPLFNTLPLRVQMKDRQNMHDLVSATQKTVFETVPVQPSPLRRIVRNQKLYGQPLFDTLVLMQSGNLSLDESIWTMPEEEGNMHFPGVIIEILPSVKTDQLTFKLHVQSEKLDSFTAWQILENYETLLVEIMQYPQAQGGNFASISSNLPQRYTTNITRTESRDPQLDDKVEDHDSLNDLELNIRELFSQFSGVDAAKIWRTTSIFELGLDSLHVVQIASHLRGLGHTVTGADVLQAKTLGRLSQDCTLALRDENRFNNNTFDLQAFDRTHRDAVCEQLKIPNSNLLAVRPCTSTQSGILTEFINSKGALYFNTVVLKLEADIDLKLLKDAWQTAMNRNEMLRTGFLMLNTSQHPYCMVTYAEGTRKLPWLPMKDFDENEAKSIAQECLQRLHRPCWRLLLKERTSSIQLEVHMLHSLYDVNSLSGLLLEVAATYRGQKLSLPKVVPVTPALLAILNQSEASSKNSSEFWRNMAAGVQPSRFPNLNIHEQLPRDSVTISRTCDSLMGELEQGCRELDVTLQSVSQIAWAQLLAAYTGDPKVMFGVVLSGRTLPETANVMFPTINTVPFSIQVQESTDDMLMEATKINVGLFKHQFAPTTTIKQMLQLEGELYDTILVLQKTLPERVNDRPWKLVNDRAAAEYAISMEVIPESNDTIELRITTRLDVMPRDHARVLLDQYETLLRGIVRKSNNLGLKSETLLSVVSAKDTRIPTKIRLLHDLVQEKTMEKPEATALEFVYSIADGIEKCCWTYTQLNEESNKIAHLLIAYGVRPGDFVAICFNKCPEASFAILGVLKSGCAYVAIDPAAPVVRKRFILEDSRCKVVLTTKDVLFSLENGAEVTVLPVDDQDIVQSHPTSTPVLKREVQPSDTCYCLYTSGTTGQPKGCLISHGSVVQAMLSFQRIFAGHWDSNSRFLQFASFHFDVSVLEQYWSWSVGICVTSAPRDILFEDLPKAIDALQITHLDLTPSLARLLKPEKVSSLCRGVFIVGGEQVTQDIIDTWGDFGCLYNFYGPSEVTIGCTVHRRVKKHVKATNIGQAWDNVGTFVLEPGSQKPVLRGAVGELCLSGPLVGKGYLNRPELTAQKFVTLKEFNIEVYRTGDLVQLLHDDSFEFLGRIDDQIKLRGQRLEIREINHSITQASASILDVATVVIKHVEKASEQLVAFFTIQGQVTKSSKVIALTSSTAESLVSKVRRHLQDTLPAYMVPTHLLAVSHIPLSANNKADLKALKAFFVAMPVRSLQSTDWNSRSIVPVSATVNKIITILATFLGVSEMTISPSSRLFELGLDSISAVPFASVLRKEGFKNTDAATVMRRAVLADLAHELDALEGDDYENDVNMAKHEIKRFRHAHEELFSSFDGIESVWPCTPLQEDMLSKTVHRSDTINYLSAFHYVLNRAVTSNAVVYAWTQVQERLPILRTTFKVLEKQYAHVVRQHCVPPVRHRNLTLEEDVMVVLEQNASKWCNEVDVLGNEPCWEVEILETATGQLYMSLRIFHGLYDAISLSILLKEVAYLIRNATTRRGQQAFDFHENLAYGPLCQRAGAKDFWMKKLSNPILLNLPPVQHHFAGPSITYSVEQALPTAFVEKRNGLSVTDSAIFQAACLLSSHLNYGIFPTLGMVVSGRSFPATGVENICGPLFNTIPFQVTPKSDWSRKDLIKACHDFNVESKPFEHTPLRSITKWINLGGGKVLFDMLFVFQRETKDNLDVSEGLWNEVGQTTTTDYPLNFEVSLHKAKFKLAVVADPEFLRENDLRSLSSTFLSVFEQLVAEPEALLFLKHRQNIANGQAQPSQTARLPRTINVNILQQVKSQVAILAQQDVANLVDDVNFFSLGLDSISLISLSGALRKVGLPISVNIIMRLSTPIQVAQYLSERKIRPVTVPKTIRESQMLFKTSQSELKDALSKQNVSINRFENVWPVTPMQESVLANFEKYYHFNLLKLSVDTDLSRLQIAWDSAIKLHPVLRSRFITMDDPNTRHVFAQLIAKPQDRIWKTSHITAEYQLRDVINQKTGEMINSGMDYPSIITHFIAVSNSQNRYFLLGMSHAIYDGWSIQLLQQDILSLYNWEQVRRPPVEPYLQYITSCSPSGATAFWVEQISNYISKPFPRSANHQTVKSTAYKMSIKSRTQSSELRRFCMKHAVTVQTLGLAIWTTVLASYLQTRDICFGVVLACRDTEEADQLIFPTFNTIPFRPQFRGGSNLDLLEHIHRLSLQIAEHQNFPLKEIKKLHVQTVKGYAELFDTLFVMQKKPTSNIKFSKLYEEVDVGEYLKLEYPVNVEMDVGETINWTVAADENVLDKYGVSELVCRLENTLEAILQKPYNVAMNISEAERGLQVANKKLNKITGSEMNERSSKETNAADADLRIAIFKTIAAVAHCSVESLSGDTNIYSIGLDSISVIKATGLLRKKGIALPVSKIVAAVTLDRIVNEARSFAEPECVVRSGRPMTPSTITFSESVKSYLLTQGIADVAVETVISASAGQIFMLDFYQASHGQLFYPKFRYRLQNRSISKDSIFRAWKEVVQALPALRTRFVEENGVKWQVVIKPSALDLHPPAAHLTVVQEPEEETIIELQLHHALYDAVSMPMIISALERACQSQALQPSTGESARARFIQATRGDDTSASKRKLWTEYLAQAHYSELPSSGSFGARRVEHVKENAIADSEPLISSAAAAGVSLQAVFLAAVGHVYARMLSSRQDNVILGVYLANRGLDIEGLEDLPVPTVSVVPLVIDVTLSLFECAKNIQTDLAVVQRAENCGVTLQEIYEWTGAKIDWFVNFVPRVEARGDDDSDMHGDGDGVSERVKLVSYPLEGRENALRQGQERTSPFLGSEPVKKMPWCVPNIDVEAKLEVDGGLTMGVFAPHDKLAGARLRGMLEEIRDVLTSF